MGKNARKRIARRQALLQNAVDSRELHDGVNLEIEQLLQGARNELRGRVRTGAGAVTMVAASRERLAELLSVVAARLGAAGQAEAFEALKYGILREVARVIDGRTFHFENRHLVKQQR
jgi:hypothetical protein